MNGVLGLTLQSGRIAVYEEQSAVSAAKGVPTGEVPWRIQARQGTGSRKARSRTRLQGLSGAAQRGGSTQRGIQTGKPCREKPITEARLRDRRHLVML